MKIPKVSIIILNYNGLTDTKKCLNSLLKTKYSNFEVIVADNGSKTDESLILKKKFTDKRFKFIRFEKNYGFSGGNNRVVNLINSKYIALLNNDTIVTPNWLNPLIKTLEEDNTIAVVQPKILWMDNKRYFDYAGACGGFIDILGYPFTKGRIFYTQEKDKGQYDSISDIFWASGAAMIIRRNIFKKIGYFDERFFNYMEEIDLCFRIHRAGFRVICNPKSVIYHKGAVSSSGNEMKKRFWEHRNNLLLILKNYPLRTLVYVIPIRLFLEIISIFHYAIKTKFDFVQSVILSLISLSIIAPSILLGNNHRINLDAYKKNNLIFKNSIVLKYFIFKKRKFSQIFTG